MDIAIQANISNTNNSNNKIEKESFFTIKIIINQLRMYQMIIKN